jgi:AAA15 family ATPase/GTPase
MLIGFSVKNYKSFFDETQLSMVATTDREHIDFNVFTDNAVSLLKNLLIFGVNASGKSNFFDALALMQKMISSSIDVQTQTIHEFECFYFRRDAALKPIGFEITILLEGVVYDYGFEILKGEVHREYLFHKDEIVFERTGKKFELGVECEGLESVTEFVRNDSLFLNWAAWTNNPIARAIVDWISHKLIILRKGESPDVYPLSASDFITRFVNKADISLTALGSMGREFGATYQGFDEKWTEDEPKQVPFEKFASSGTRQLYRYSAAFEKAFSEPVTIVIDDFGLHLHPDLSAYLLSMFNSIAYNPSNSQLICATHDVLLLNEDLRKDQIWFVEKDEHNVSRLYALSEFKEEEIKKGDTMKRYLLDVYKGNPRQLLE